MIEKECLTLLYGFKKFKKYLNGKEFILKTNHASLSYIQICKIESLRIMRWTFHLILQCYKFKVKPSKVLKIFLQIN